MRLSVPQKKLLLRASRVERQVAPGEGCKARGAGQWKTAYALERKGLVTTQLYIDMWGLECLGVQATEKGREAVKGSKCKSCRGTGDRYISPRAGLPPRLEKCLDCGDL